MNIAYKGRDKNYKYRIAEISCRDDEDDRILNRVVQILCIKGWNVDIVTTGYAICEVSDKQEYREFAQDYKEAKGCIQMCERYGF